MNIKKFNIGIIGKGFVGSAVAGGFSASSGFDSVIRIFDIDPKKSIHTLEETVIESDFLFISVPTPANDDGSIDLSYLDSCLGSINEINGSSRPIILVRSTVVPGSTSQFQEKYKNLRLVFNPEFLTERNALFDFLSQQRFILGGEDKNTTAVEELIQARFGKTVAIIKTDFETAELIKYMCNTFFATKISFLNEMFLIAKACNADWDVAREGFIRDGRVGTSHTNVPGHDGKAGFGGHCFPKDIQALISFSNQLGIKPNTLEGAWKTNLEVRPEKDWEKK
jgi:UDPglucose 6-dehydrogenase